MSDSGSDSDVEVVDPRAEYRAKKRLFLFCIDVSKNGKASITEDFIKILLDLLTALIEVRKSKHTYGIVLVGVTNDAPDAMGNIVILLNPKSSIGKSSSTIAGILKAGIEQSYGSIENAPLLNSLQFAVDLIRDIKSDLKTVVYLTSSAQEQYCADELSNIAIDYKRANVEFLVLPLERNLTDNDVFEIWLDKLENENNKIFDVVQEKSDIQSVLLNLLKDNDDLFTFKFYYTKNSFFTMQGRKLFRKKIYTTHHKARENERKEVPMVNVLELPVLEENPDGTWTAEPLLVSKRSATKLTRIPKKIENNDLEYDEIQLVQDDLRNLRNVTGYEDSSLTLLYVMEKRGLPPDGIFFRQGNIFMAPSDNNAHQVLFTEFWQYCYDNDKILICQENNKYCFKTALKPTSYKGQRVFINITIGHADNYNFIKYEPKVENVWNSKELSDVMDKIVEALHVEGLSCVSIKDPAQENMRLLEKAKLTNTPMEKLVDETSADYHKVDKKVGRLSENLNSALKNMH